MIRLFSKPLLVNIILVLLLSTAPAIHTTVEKSKFRFVGGNVRLVETDSDVPTGSTYAVKDYAANREVGLEGVESNGYLPKERFNLPYDFALEIQAFEHGNCDWVFTLGNHFYRMRKI